MYKVTAKTKGYDRIEFVFDNMTEASAFMAGELKREVPEGFPCHLAQFVPVSDLKKKKKKPPV